MNCNEVREHLSPHLEDRLGSEKRAAVSVHLLACVACRALHDEMRALLSDLSELSKAQEIPAGLDERILARVPSARPRQPRRTAQSVAWQRAAVWAFVFFGAWWQLVGARLGALAADELAPIAAEYVAEAKQATLRGQAELMPSEPFVFSLSEPVSRAGDSLSSFSRAVHRALFVPEPESAVQPQTRPVPENQGDNRP